MVITEIGHQVFVSENDEYNLSFTCRHSSLRTKLASIDLSFRFEQILQFTLMKFKSHHFLQNRDGEFKIQQWREEMHPADIADLPIRIWGQLLKWVWSGYTFFSALVFFIISNPNEGECVGYTVKSMEKDFAISNYPLEQTEFLYDSKQGIVICRLFFPIRMAYELHIIVENEHTDHF